MAAIRINGQPAGSPCDGVVNVAGQGTARVTATIDGSTLTSDRYYDVVFSFDLDGDSVPDAATSVGLGDVGNLTTVSVEPGVETPLESLRWIRASPNPFTQSTTIQFETAQPGRIGVEIYDIVGRKVRDLSRDVSTAGIQGLVRDGRDESGDVENSGVYMVRVRFDRRVVSAQMLRCASVAESGKGRLRRDASPAGRAPLPRPEAHGLGKPTPAAGRKFG